MTLVDLVEALCVGIICVAVCYGSVVRENRRLRREVELLRQLEGHVRVGIDANDEGTKNVAAAGAVELLERIDKLRRNTP